MPTVVDSLVVTLGLDPAKFQQGEREVTAGLKRVRDQSNTTAKEMEASGKQAAQFFAQAKIEALGLIGTLVGASGMLAFTQNTTRSLAELGRTALNIGVAIPQLNAFRNVIERNGGSADSATASMKGLVDQIERFKVFGDPSVFKFLNPIGANINDTPLGIWQKFVEFADKHRNDPALVNLIGHGLGFDQGLINASLQIKGAADAARQLADETGRVATPDMVQNATELQKAWEDLQHQAVFTGEAVLNNLSPALKDVLVWGKDQIAQKPALIEAITAIVGGLVGLGAIRISAGLMGLTGLSKVIGGLVGFMERLAPYAALLLSLHGDTPTHEDPVEPGGEFFGEHGAFGKWWSRTMPEFLGGASPTHTADTDMSPEQRAFLDTLAAGESKSYNDVNPTSGARGRYQFLGSTNAEVSKQTGIAGFDPVSQDRKAWFYASTNYLRKTGRDLANDLRAGGHEQDITNALNGVWPSLPGGSQQNTTSHQFATRMRDNLAANSMQKQATTAPPVPPMLPGEPAPIAHSRPIGPDLSHLTNRPVGATLGNWLWNRLDPALVPQPGASVSNSTSNSSSVHIGTQVVNSRANDAAGIAGDIRDATTDAFIQQANRGLQ